MSAMKDVCGQTFGRLKVIHRVKNNASGAAMWHCRCQCGEEKVVSGGALRSGSTRSCGCLNIYTGLTAGNTIHGHSNSPEYHVWEGIKARCYNQNHHRYDDWGGRGITMCERWRDSFEAFLEDMGPKPSPHHSIEREKNDEGYSKANCRWATPKEQAANRRPRADGLFTRKEAVNG